MLKLLINCGLRLWQLNVMLNNYSLVIIYNNIIYLLKSRQSSHILNVIMCVNFFLCVTPFPVILYSTIKA